MPRFLGWLIVSMTCCVGCLTIYPEDHWAVDKERSTGSEDTLADQSNAFALDLYAQLRAGYGNLFFSPYSISTALAMTSAGARGQTLDEMARVLHFPDQAALHPAMASLTAP